MTDAEKIKKLRGALGEAVRLLKDSYHDGSDKTCGDCVTVREIEETYEQVK